LIPGYNPIGDALAAHDGIVVLLSDQSISNGLNSIDFNPDNDVIFYTERSSDSPIDIVRGKMDNMIPTSNEYRDSASVEKSVAFTDSLNTGQKVMIFGSFATGAAFSLLHYRRFFKDLFTPKAREMASR
jgi:hypothetical protein